jgi:hypothetical protein
MGENRATAARDCGPGSAVIKATSTPITARNAGVITAVDPLTKETGRVRLRQISSLRPIHRK